MRRAFLLLFVLALPLAAQEAAPQRVTIESKILGETRTLLVRLPASYAVSERSYPVIYMTDGDRQLPHTAATADFLAREGRMPEVILVGITNTDRTRDLTPTHVEDPSFEGASFRAPTSGGAGKFLSFLESEVIPHVEKSYRTQPYRVFTGHSFGGLFAMHALFARPSLFNAIVAVSPTFAWDDVWINRRVTEFIRDNRGAKNTLVLTMGDEGELNDRELERFRSLMKSKAPSSLVWSVIRFDDEDHGSVVLPSHYAGLRKVFADWRFPAVRGEDPLRSLSRAREHYTRLSSRLGYTVPIPEPTVNNIGYRLLQAGKTTEAIAVFKSNADAYPKSANVYDSLAEAYERAGDLALAKENYERAAGIGKNVSDPNANIYEKNRERVAKALASQGSS